MSNSLFKKTRKLDRWEYQADGVLFYCKEKPAPETEGKAVRIAEKYRFRLIKLADILQKDTEWKRKPVPRMEFIKNLQGGQIDLDYNVLTFPHVHSVDGDEELVIRMKFMGELDHYDRIVAIYKNID